jgi:hypothetical protein
LGVKEFKQAIPPHSTATSEDTWDGSAARAALRNDGSAAYYRSAFAWVDPDGDPETKTAYKFIHHEIGSDGTVGAANLSACSTGIGVLNGGRVGTTIPDADRQGVWAHLAKHLRDADREPPELRSKNLTMEDEAMHALSSVQAFVYRTEALGSLRAEKEGKAGCVLSASSRERIQRVLEGMRDVMGSMEQMLAESDPEKHRKEFIAEYARYERLRASI